MTTKEEGSKIGTSLKKFLTTRIRSLELKLAAATTDLWNQAFYKKRCKQLERNQACYKKVCKQLERKIKTLEHAEKQRLRNRYTFFD
jgi:hypothetical protein